MVQVNFFNSLIGIVDVQTAEIPLQTSAVDTANLVSTRIKPMEFNIYPNPIHDYVIIRGALKGASYVIMHWMVQ